MPPTGTMEKWEGVRVALKYRPVCPQRMPPLGELAQIMSRSRVEQFARIAPFIERQTEECLNLNLYLPAVKSKNVVIRFKHKLFSIIIK